MHRRAASLLGGSKTRLFERKAFLRSGISQYSPRGTWLSLSFVYYTLFVFNARPEHSQLVVSAEITWLASIIFGIGGLYIPTKASGYPACESAEVSDTSDCIC